MMNPAAPYGASLCCGSIPKKNAGNHFAPPCLGEALKRGNIVNIIFMLRVRTPVHACFDKAKIMEKREFYGENWLKKVPKHPLDAVALTIACG